jgi:hypothetical protein
MALPTPATFRADFPEFSDITTYPDSLINFWLGIGVLRLNPIWGSLLNQGLELFTAHFISLSAMNQKTVVAGGVPGLQRGVISAESAEISVSYDTAASTLKDMGHWNLTVYGTQFQELANLVGMGPIQVSPSWWNVNGIVTNGFGWPFFPS